MSDQSDDDQAPEALPDLGGLLGGAAGGGMPDLGGLMEQAQQMMAKAQQAAEQIVTGSAGDRFSKLSRSVAGTC